MNDKTFIRAVNAQDSQAVRRLLPILSIEHLNQLHDSRTVHGEMAALHVAAYKGHSEIIDLLMQDSRVDLNLQTSKGYTALELAIDNSHLATTRQLLATQQVLLLHPVRTQHPYFLAMEKITLPMHNQNLKKIEDAKEIAALLRLPTFIKACETGKLSVIWRMAAEGLVDVNGRIGDEWGLKAACLHNHIAVVECLLSLPQIKLDIRAFAQGFTLLHLLSLTHPSNHPPRFPLSDCSFTNPSLRYLLIEMLIKRGADPNVLTLTGRTPLYLATVCNLLDAVKALVTHGADLSLRIQRETLNAVAPEEFAASKERVKQLIEHDSSLYPACKPLLTPTGDLAIDWTECTGQGVTQWDIFQVAQNHPEILQYLLQARQDNDDLAEIRAIRAELCHPLTASEYKDSTAIVSSSTLEL